jgi:hypothetical protein
MLKAGEECGETLPTEGPTAPLAGAGEREGKA